MASQSSNLRASSSSRRSRSMEEIERQLDAAKRQRSSQLDATVAHAHANGAATVPVVPLHYAAGGHAMTVAFPMAGVNGAALQWSSAATLGAASSRAAGLPPPAMAGVNGPAAPPFVVGPVLIGPPAPAPAVGTPLAVALDKIKNNTLGSMLSSLMMACDPPVRQRQGWTGAPPPWWPTATEDWWGSEVTAHLNTMPVPPFAPAYKLKKLQKVAVLVAIVKHLAPDFDGISEKVGQNAKAKMTAEDKKQWKDGLENEAARRKSGSVPMVPVFNFNLVLQQQQQAQPPPPLDGDGHRLAPIGAATTENVVRGGAAVAAVDGGEQQVVNNLAGASVTLPTGDGGQAVAAAEPEQHGDGALHGGSIAAVGGCEKPVEIPSDDGAPLGDDVHQVAAAEPEEQCLIHGSDAVAADMDQLLNDMLAPYQMQQGGGEVHQVVDVEVPGAEVAVEVAPEVHPWYVEDDIHMSSTFDDFEVPEVTLTPHPYYY